MRRLPLVLLAASLLAGVALAVPSARSTAAAPSLSATLHADPVRPGQALHVTGRLDRAADAVKVQVQMPTGELRGPYGPFAVTGDRIDATLPGDATAGLRPTSLTGYALDLGVQVLPATATETSTAATAEPRAAQAAVVAPPSGPVLQNSFVSSKGWVKPGDTYPFRLIVKNFGAAPVDGGQVTVPAVDGTTFTRIAVGSGARIDGGRIVWDVGAVPGTTNPRVPAASSIVVEAKADTVSQDPQIVWKNLSTTATGTATGAPVISHGPKVIPPSESYDTARYGDRPFPVVPVEYADRSRGASSQADLLAKKIDDPSNPGSTFNLYQEMSYGQLFPNGTVPSDGIATADWSYQPGFSFTHTVPGNTCQSPSTADLPGDAYQQRGPRIKDGWYELPGTTGYYGADGNGSALIGAEAGVGALQAIDSGCGPTGKAVYDAAQIADPEINYDDYDTDKDGVVDFFMMIFVGKGGNGDSQINGTPPYDNIWPHSSTLEASYTDAHGQKGYVSDDQRTDIEGRPLWYTDTSFTKTTTENKGDALKALVRVGPYNVNPETAIAKASVISHEYGHSLGLPDYYSTGSRQTYGSWNLMAEDHSHHMDVNGRQELGWLIPRVLDPDKKVDAKNIADSITNTHRIDWQTSDGKPYTLSGPTVNNGEGYVAKLKQRQVIDPKLVPWGSPLWWPQAGNDFGCPPTKGHNLDIDLRQLAGVPAGTKVTLSFKSRWQIEWDFDYGFVLGTTDGGKTYTSFPSANGYTTPQAQNPNNNDCQAQYGNGITGSDGSYKSNTQEVDRVAGNYPEGGFVDDSYDLSSLAGKSSVLRLAYATDTGLAKAGWFIDDIKVTAGDKVIYASDVEQADDPAVFNGGCREGLQTSSICTKGWQFTSAVDGDPADHAYYMEMRDRAGFDLRGHGEDDRDDPSSTTDGIAWQPGFSLVYTDENHGYGNVGTADPPAQTPLDAVPESGSDTPDLNDAAFKPAGARARYSDGGAGHVDNYSTPDPNDPGNPVTGQAALPWKLAFNCLTFQVTRMAGDDNGPETPPANLTGDVSFDMGGGCGKFDYGYGRGSNAVSVPGVTAAAAANVGRCPARASAYRGTPRARHAGRGVRFTVRPKSRFRVDIVKAAGTRSVLKKPRLVRRFSARRASFTWNGRGRGVTDGTYVARVVSTVGKKTDARRITLRRSHGRFSVRPAYERTTSCGLVRSFRATRPAFKRPLSVSYRLAAKSTVTIAVLRGKKVVRRYKAATRSANRTYRRTISAKGLPHGELRVVLSAKAGNASSSLPLTVRRL